MKDVGSKSPFTRSAWPFGCLAVGAFFGASVVAHATGLTLAPEFSDHAVLQREKPVPIWGTAAAGETVSVSFGGQIATGTTTSAGRWQVMLHPLPANDRGRELTVTSGSESLTRSDILVGEVWLCSGQSNMEWPLRLAKDAATELPQANAPWLRELASDKRPSDDPLDTLATQRGWVVATPQTAGDFTAVGYFFAQALHRRLGVPVGLVYAAWGGTPIEPWVPKPTLEKSIAWPEFERNWREALKTFPQAQRDYPALDQAWRNADEESRRTGKPNPLPWPHPPVGPGTAYAPGDLYNGMIHPLAPYAVRGIVWYQGESNVGRAREYADLFPAMIRDWRTLWADPKLPFLFVQLPNFADANPADTTWAELRHAQEAALALPNTGMAVTIDLGEAHNLHPTDKRPVGERLERVAAARVYGAHIEWSGPTVRAVRRDGEAMEVRFDHAAGLTLRGNGAGFELAGTDGIFAAAKAAVQGNTVRVSAPAVPRPTHIRYAWANQPAVSLYNAAGLPAAPFEARVQ